MTLWKLFQISLAEEKCIQYNFVKPHMASEENTPAVAARLQVKGWKALLEKAVNNQT
jgi:hypothetical protein